MAKKMMSHEQADKKKRLEEKLTKAKATFFDLMAQQQQVNQMMQRQVQEVNNIQAELNTVNAGFEDSEIEEKDAI